MKQKIILNIGLAKTGSTFLRREIFPKINNAVMLDCFSLTTKLPNDKHIIISDPDLSIPPYRKGTNPSMRKTVLKRLHKLFPDAYILLGIRNKKTWVKSLYSQYLKTGEGYKSFSEFEKLIDKRFLNFDEYIKDIDTIFEKYYIYEQEKLLSDTQNVINEMFKFLELQPPIIELKIWNKSANKRQEAMYRMLNRYRGRFIPEFVFKEVRYIFAKITSQY